MNYRYVILTYIIFFLLLVVALVFALLGFYKNTQTTDINTKCRLNAKEVSIEPSKNIDSNNVEDALTELSQLATRTHHGLMSNTDKTRLDQTPILSNGSIVYQASKNATVTIVSTYPNSSQAFGSGFILSVDSNSKLLIGTCAHVLLQAGGTEYPLVKASKVEVVISGANGDPKQNVQIVCEIIGIDAAADIGIIKTMNVTEEPLTGFNFTSKQAILTWGDSTSLIPGMECYIIGNPLGSDFASIAHGVVRDNKYIGTFDGGSIESLYSSAPILPGNSGSPVLDVSGRLIGISCWVSTSSSIAQSNFVGGPNQFMAEKIVKKITETGTDFTGASGKGYLGISEAYLVAGLTLSNLRKTYPNFASSSVDNPQGLYLKNIDIENIKIPNSRLHNAGVFAGDILLSLTHNNVTTEIGAFENQYSPSRITWFVTPGDTVEARILRPSTSKTFPVSVIIDEYPVEKDIIFSGNAGF